MTYVYSFAQPRTWTRSRTAQLRAYRCILGHRGQETQPSSWYKTVSESCHWKTQIVVSALDRQSIQGYGQLLRLQIHDHHLSIEAWQSSCFEGDDSRAPNLMASLLQTCNCLEDLLDGNFPYMF